MKLAYLFLGVLSSLIVEAQLWNPISGLPIKKSILVNQSGEIGVVSSVGKEIIYRDSYYSSTQEVAVPNVDPSGFNAAFANNTTAIAFIDGATWQLNTYAKIDGIWKKGSSNLAEGIVYGFSMASNDNAFYIGQTSTKLHYKQLIIHSSSDGVTYKKLPLLPLEKGRVDQHDIKFDKDGTLYVLYQVSLKKKSLLKLFAFKNSKWKQIGKTIKHNGNRPRSVQLSITSTNKYVSFTNEVTNMTFDYYKLEKGKWKKQSGFPTSNTRFTLTKVRDDVLYVFHEQVDSKTGRKVQSINIATFDGSKWTNTKCSDIPLKNLSIQGIELTNKSVFVKAKADGKLYFYKLERK